MGNRIFGLNVYSGRKRLAHLGLSRLESPFQYMLVLPQSDTERILADHLVGYGIHVEWNHELTQLTELAEGIRAQVRVNADYEESIHADWIVGCDGAHSRIREQLDLAFRGGTYPEEFILADVEVQSQLSPHELHGYFHPHGVLALVPIHEPLWRVILADVPPADSPHQQPKLAEVQSLVDERGPGGLELANPQWLSRFRIFRRRVPRLRRQRALLAGDAAHICSPVGGQGMNLGIQDAANLGWKLAAVIRGIAPEELLDTYSAERVPVANDTLELTDRLTRLVTLENWLAIRAKPRALHPVAHSAAKPAVCCESCRLEHQLSGCLVPSGRSN